MQNFFIPSESQEAVIKLNNGYNLVLAGPGCGKTQVLAERLAYAFEHYNLSLSEALCLTFTNRAARGMYARVSSRLGNNAEDLFIGNVHRYCSHFLFENKLIPHDTFIMDEDDISKLAEATISFETILNIIGSSLYDGKYCVGTNWDLVQRLFLIDDFSVNNSGKISLPNMMSIVGRVRGQILKMSHLVELVLMGVPEEFLLHANLWHDSNLGSLYPTMKEFQEACKNAQNQSSLPMSPVAQYLFLALEYKRYKDVIGAVDFDDLLVKTYEAYRNDKDAKFKRYQWVQVDEVQDLSKFQIALIDILTKEDAVVVYFGDEQQAIYSFMGASLTVLNALKKRCKNILRLDKNYRSPKYLLDLFNEYAIKQLKVDASLLPQAKDAQVASPGDLKLAFCSSDRSEELFLINEVKSRLVGNERTAVLVPWNRDAAKLSQILETNNVKHFKISGGDIFKTVGMRMLLAHFNVVSNPLSTISWGNILVNSFAFNKLGKACDFVRQMKELGMTPEDLLSDDGITYTGDFWHAYQNEECVVFDTETTGLDIVNDDIVQIAAVKVYKGKIVPNSQFNLFLKTEKSIPEMLGNNVNPMVEAYRNAEKVPRKEGLQRFCEYVGDLPVIGHNVNYDYNILRYNLGRESMMGMFRSKKIFDTLFLARLLIPQLPIYKLGYLLDRLGLGGVNSHMANDDVLATFELAKYCHNLLQNKLPEQVNFLRNRQSQFAIKCLLIGYKDSYWHTKKLLWEYLDNEKQVLVTEMKYIHDRLVVDCELAPVPHFDEYILDFISHDVLESNEQNMLASQLSKHLMDLNTYKEADLCDSSVMKEKLFVSTVHKAKGLEFENVILMRANNNRYPKFSSNTPEKVQEDKRLFYVAMSRAMKRLTICGSHLSRESLTSFVIPIKHHFSR